MAMEKVPMTIEGFKKLEAELHRLKVEERPRIIQQIADAREHGDLSENAEYHAAKEAQGLNEAKVADVFLMLAENQAIETTTADSVDFKTSVDDMSHWAGIPAGQCRETLNHFVALRWIELQPDRIVVKNLNAFVRLVSSRRKHQEK